VAFDPIIRPELQTEDLLRVLAQLKQKYNDRVDKHGPGILVSSHEILGVVVEEYDEVKAEVQANRLQGLHRELEDLAVACIVGMVSLRSGRVQW